MNSPRLRTPLAAATIFILALALYLATASPTITMRAGGVDGGELTATALSGGVAHPSGYPTYMLLARVALALPWSEPAAGLVRLSGVFGALAAASAAALVMWSVETPLPPKLDEERPPRPGRPLGEGRGIRSIPHSPRGRPGGGEPTLLAGLFTGFSLMLSERFWSQALIVEVYTLHMFWLSLCALLWLGWLTGGNDYLLPVTAFCLGLGAGTHLTILILAPALAMATVSSSKLQGSWRRCGGIMGVAFLAGFSVYGLLPIWAARGAAPSWGDQRTIGGLWAHISGQEYRYLAGIVPWSQRIGRLSFAVRDLLLQPGLAGLILSVGWGLPYCWRKQRPLALATGTVALGSLVFAISYGGADGSVYLLPWTWAWCVWGGVGLFDLGRSLRLERRTVALILIVIVAGSSIWSLTTQYRALDLSADTTYRDQVIAQLEALPPATILVTDDDAETFGAWYAQRALELRPDVLVVDTRLLARAWYRVQLAQQLGLPDEAPLCVVLAQPKQPVFEAQGTLVTQASAALLTGTCST